MSMAREESMVRKNGSRVVAERACARYPVYVNAFELPPLPLREDEHGVVRITGSRVTLDSVVALFDRGATAEEIAQSFPSLTLGSIYAVLSYVVARRGDVDAYLATRGADEAAARNQAEQCSPSGDLRAKLLRRRDTA